MRTARSAQPEFRLDRYTQIGELAQQVQRLLRRIRLPLIGALIAGVIFLSAKGLPGVSPYVLIAIGTLIPLEIWTAGARGLPLLPLIALQNLALYEFPIIFQHEGIVGYSSQEFDQAGMELLIHGISLAVAWRVGMQMFAPGRAISYALPAVNREGLKGLGRLGFSLIVGATAYLILQTLGLLNFVFALIPQGSASILFALYSACTVCGFFLVAMAIGSNGMDQRQKAFFWVTLAVNALVSAAGFILSGSSILLSTVAIGLFWGSGKIPKRYLIVVIALLGFLNLGKFTMRERYWKGDETGEYIPDAGLMDMPNLYMDWANASFEALGHEKANPSPYYSKADAHAATHQTLLDRLDNLQTLLFIIHAVGTDRISVVHGETYKLIPALLVPRILWPDKPRTHEGQVLLNVHFGRQDLFSTFTTYVAWGLLPEAYANFGPMLGAIFLGVVMGFSFAWLENVTARKLVVSLEGFIAFDIILSMLNSFEMVASVLVTSAFQSLVPIAIACLPFVRKTRTDRPQAEPEQEPPALE